MYVFAHCWRQVWLHSRCLFIGNCRSATTEVSPPIFSLPDCSFTQTLCAATALSCTQSTASTIIPNKIKVHGIWLVAKNNCTGKQTWNVDEGQIGMTCKVSPTFIFAVDNNDTWKSRAYQACVSHCVEQSMMCQHGWCEQDCLMWSCQWKIAKVMPDCMPCWWLRKVAKRQWQSSCGCLRLSKEVQLD